MELTFSFKDTATAAEIAKALQTYATIFTGNVKAKVNAAVEDEDDEITKEDTPDDDDDFAPKKATPSKKAKASFDDDDSEDEEKAPTKSAKKSSSKAKKFTKDDVMDACRERMEKGKNPKAGRAKVKAILLEQFGVNTVHDLESDVYGDVIAAMIG